jgi:hypothetical protein
MSKTAKAIDAIVITRGPEFIDGYWWVESRVGVNDYEGFGEMPKAIEFEGRTYGLSAWNSDSGRVAYNTRVRVGRKK